MGRMVLDELARHPDVSVAWAYGRVVGPLAGADVVIDFSTPGALESLLGTVAVPLVSGTTGVVPPLQPPVALLHAANFSLGVAVLAKLVRDARTALPGWDVEVVELHHNQKQDAPSGTALRLVEGLGTRTSGRAGPRVPREIGIHSVRGGDIVGEHHVYLCGPGERIQLAHVATHRGLFAAGAVACARWIIGKKSGLYGIEDALR